MPVHPDWLLLQQGDQQAFEKIYREHVSSLYSYGKKFSTDTNLVEDCIQDMFINIWDKRLSLGDTDNIKAYLFVSIRRRIIKSIKKNRKIIDFDESILFESELAIDKIIEQSEMNVEKSKKLKTAFDKLNKNQQHIIYLKYYQGFNSNEISEILDINNQSVRNKLSRAVAKLKQYFMTWMVLLTIEIINCL